MGIFLLSTLRCSLKTLPPRFLHHLLTLISVGIYFLFDKINNMGKHYFALPLSHNCAPVVLQLSGRCVAILPFLL